MGYDITLVIHSYLRWAIVIFGVLAVAKAIGGWLGKKPWSASDDKLGMIFVSCLDLQLLTGLVLFLFFSPITDTMFQAPGAAMGNRVTRFFSVEHTAIMVIGLALAHIGRARARRATDPVAKHRTTAIFLGLGLLIILAGVPWPFLSYGRPWLRF